MKANAIRTLHPAHTGITASLPVSDDPFVRAIREGIRQTRRSCAGLSRKEHRLLDDLTKVKYVNGLRQFVEITRTHCTDPRDAVALWDKLAALTLTAHVEDYTVTEAYGLENFANYELNDAQDIHALNASTGTVDRVVEKASAQEVASAVLKHAVLRQRPTLVQVLR